MLTWLRKKMRTILIVVVVVFAASIFYGLGMGGFRGGGRSKKRILAKVNGKEIDPLRYREILSRLVHSFGEEVGPQNLAFLENLALSQAVDFQLMLSEARRKVRVPRREVKAALENIMQSQKFSSQKEFEVALKRTGLSLARFKRMLREDILIHKLTTKMREEVKMGPEDLREIRGRHILVTEEAIANQLLKRIKKGESFTKLAKLYSIDPGSKNKGGDLGYFTTGTMVEPFEKAAFALKVGEMSKVVKTQFGYHIIKVTDSRLRKFSGKEKDLEKAALAEKQEKVFRRWHGNLKNKAKIEIIDPVFRGHAARFAGRVAEALVEYKKALQTYPANSYLHVYVGDVYTGLGKDDLAITEYEKAIEVGAGNPYLYIILGNAYKKQKNRKPALAQYRKASLIAGDNKSMHEKLLAIFKELRSWKDIAKERAEIKRIEKKEKFEKELKGEK